jgi:hypothetical protein
MAVLTSSGIQFSVSDTLISTYEIYPLNSVAVFYQANAPTGWTKSTTHNDKALRCVSGTGGGSGGTNAFTSSFPNATIPVSGSAPVTGSVGNTTLTTPQLAVHAHPNGFGGAGRHGWQSGGEGLTGTGNNGGGGAHAHPWSGSGPFSFSFDVRVQYIDAIICTRTS